MGSERTCKIAPWRMLRSPGIPTGAVSFEMDSGMRGWMETQIVWAEALPPGTSAQRAELIALTKALQLGKDKKLNIITDSQYAFATAHIHGAIYRERGLLTAKGKTIKNKEEIKALLSALWLLKKLAIIHCLGHQKPDTPISRGNNLAERAARDAAQNTMIEATLQLPDPGSPILPALPNYSTRDLDWIKSLPMAQQLVRW